MKKQSKKIKILFLITFILLITASILLRIDNEITKLIGIILLIPIIFLGFVIIIVDKKTYSSK